MFLAGGKSSTFAIDLNSAVTAVKVDNSSGLDFAREVFEGSVEVL